MPGMEDMLSHLLGAESDEADDPSATSDDPEGDLLSLEELAALGSPEDEETDLEASGDDDAAIETESAEEDDRDARIAALEAERDRIQLDRQRLNDERQAEAIRRSQQAWQQEEAQVYHQASQAPDWQTASAQLVNFYRGEIQKITSASQMVIANLMQGQYVDQAAQVAGLDAEDRALLAGLPHDKIPQIAQALAAKNQKANQRLSGIETELQQLKRGRQAQRRARTNADGLSGSRGQSAPRQSYVDGSAENALAIMQAMRAQKAARGR